MSGTVYRFAQFTVDLGAHALYNDGVRISLQEQPFQVLLALLACPGQIVPRDVLRTRLWGTDTFVDFDQSLNSTVRRLRLALEDNAREPTFIETIPRIGFRFLPEVTTDPPAPRTPAPHRDHLTAGAATPLPIVMTASSRTAAGRLLSAKI